VDHCIATKDDARLELALPVVTALAYHIQSSYNDLLFSIQAEEEERLFGGDGDREDRVWREEERMDKELVISEMLKLAVNLDYADEIGRRKMFTLVRESSFGFARSLLMRFPLAGDMISQDSLPENLVAKCLDVLRILSANERDLIRVVVEVVHDLRDPSDPEDDVAVSRSSELFPGERNANVILTHL
jgi:condensin complex subunit 3